MAGTGLLAGCGGSNGSSAGASGSVLAALKETGGTRYSTEPATDVTGQVADVNSRIGSAQASITELRGSSRCCGGRCAGCAG